MMKQKIIAILALTLFWSLHLHAQESTVREVLGLEEKAKDTEKTEDVLENKMNSKDRKSFFRPSADINWRTYYLNEDHMAQRFRDYSAITTGLAAHFQTAQDSFFLRAGFYNSTLLASNNLSETDPVTGKGSRYAGGLLTLDDPGKHEIATLGEIYAAWFGGQKKSKQGHYDSEIIAGRHAYNSPFINTQDGRMIPSLAQGLFARQKLPYDFTVQGVFINHVWVRATDNWNSVEDSLGTLSMGTSSVYDSSTKKYLNHDYSNLNSNGIFLASVEYAMEKESKSPLKLVLQDIYVENIFNTAYAEAKLSASMQSFKLGLDGQYIYQQGTGNGGAATPENVYFVEGSDSHTYGAKLTGSWNTWFLQIAANHITADGRFLFPREWGREPLYTWQKRERTDGIGNATQYKVATGKQYGKEKTFLDDLKIEIGYGFYPRDIDKREFNKYGLPSYQQTDFDIFYRPSVLSGLELEFLVAHKRNAEEAEVPDTYLYTKADITVYNFIVNYTYQFE